MAMPAVRRKSKERTLRQRGRLDALFGFFIRAPVPLFYPDASKLVKVFSAGLTMQIQEEILMKINRATGVSAWEMRTQNKRAANESGLPQC